MTQRWTMADVIGTGLAPVVRLTKAQMREKYPKPNKFGAVKTNGYASKRESNRASQLKAMEAAGEIQFLKEQVAFELIPAQYIDGKCVERACVYKADFTYYRNGAFVVEDSKGYRDPVYRIKRKLMLWIHQYRILET